MASAAKPCPDPESLHLPPTGADSHAHLDSERLWPDFEQIMARAAAAGVVTVGQIFLSHAAYEAKADAMAAHPGVFFCMGLHPSDALLAAPEKEEKEDECTLQARAVVRDDRIRAVGEIGLDFYHRDCPAETQYAVFRRQLALARKADKPVAIHSRDAFAETVALLDEEGFSGFPLLWHCFGGDESQARALLTRGWHISIPGPVGYPANEALRQALRVIPEDRIMLETDCPYLAPQEWRGRRNEPALTVFTARAVAGAKGMDTASLWSLCGANTRRFFGI